MEKLVLVLKSDSMLDPITIIKMFGLLGIFVILFSETGLFFAFFLPGDTLLFAAGIFASQGVLPLIFLIIGCALSAILGASFGYFTGKKMGRKLFEHEASFFFNKEKVLLVERFYKKYGPVTVLFSRFIPIVRTFAPIVAGVGEMNYGLFILFNIIGGIIWPLVIVLAGYYFGNMIPNIDKLLLPIVLLVIILSLLPFIFKILHKLLFKR